MSFGFEIRKNILNYALYLGHLAKDDVYDQKFVM